MSDEVEPPVHWVQPEPSKPGPAPGVAYANWAQRAGATLIDYLVVVLVGGIPYALLGAGASDADSMLSNVGFAYIVVVFFVIYGVTTKLWNGQSVGGRVLGLRIVRRKDGGPISWDSAMVRPFGILLTALLWFISLLAVVFGKEKRTPSDVLAGTVVITGARTRDQVPSDGT